LALSPFDRLPEGADGERRTTSCSRENRLYFRDIGHFAKSAASAGSLRRNGQARGSLPFAYCFSNVKLSLTSAAGNVPAFPVKEYVPAPALPGIL